MRRIIVLCFLSCVVGCGSGELSTNSDPGDNQNNENNLNNQNNTDSDTGATQNNVNNVDVDMGTNDDTGNDASNADLGADVAVDMGPQWHPMFIAVADFFIIKCVACHAVGENGNFAMPQDANPTYEEVRLALDGTVATTNRLIIEPNDPAESQAFIMMTNAAGEQFDEPTIAVVRDWINAGAPYLVTD